MDKQLNHDVAQQVRDANLNNSIAALELEDGED